MISGAAANNGMASLASAGQWSRPGFGLFVFQDPMLFGELERKSRLERGSRLVGELRYRRVLTASQHDTCYHKLSWEQTIQLQVHASNCANIE